METVAMVDVPKDAVRGFLLRTLDEVSVLAAGVPQMADWRDDPVLDAVLPLLRTVSTHVEATRLLASAPVDVATTAPFSVLRAAIESAATVVWLLGPDELVERQLRCLRLTLTDREDFERFMARRSKDHPGDIEKFRADIFHFARSLTRNPDVQVAKIWMARIFEYVAEVTPGIGDVFGSWQMCSAFAHGRSWSSGLLAPDAEDGDSERDDVALAFVMVDTRHLIAHAFRLFVDRQS
ncbi:hypothetical protein ACFXGA_01175 [Actinosynnema sp. NPDC059335]|uniref:hypothetical protein n=1 Tax=Actinosynnema sp. NPDC059335 TaxID=3346804 RepID=UPI0036720409